MDGITPFTLEPDSNDSGPAPMVSTREPIWEWVSVRAGDSAVIIGFPVPVPAPSGF